MEKITSIQNTKIKQIAKLKSAKERKQSKLIIAEGIKLTKELILSGFEIVYCFVNEHTDVSILPSEITEDYVYIVSNSVMNKMSTMSTAPAVITVAKEKSCSNIIDSDFILALDTLQDPSNMGAIFRSAEAFGINNIILSEGCCDCYSQKVLRSSMGSALRLNIIYTSLENYLINHKNNYTIIGTGLDKNYRTVDKLNETDKKIVIIGNEGNGISSKIQNLCDYGMYIPMIGNNESLNAAVAASIILWENMRQKNE